MASPAPTRCSRQHLSLTPVRPSRDSFRPLSIEGEGDDWTLASQVGQALRGLLLPLALLVGATSTARGQWRDVAAVAVMGSATGLDLASTFACRNPAMCSEGNPVAALFYDVRAPAYLIAADAAAVMGVALLGRELRRSRSPTARRLWWVPAAAFTAVSLVAWRANVRDLQRCPACRLAQ